MELLKHPSMLRTVLVVLGVLSAGTALAQGPAQKPEGGGFQVGTSYQNDTSLPLYYLPAWSGGVQGEGREAAENPKVPNHHVDSVDPVVQHTLAPTAQMPIPILNFDGIGFPGVACNCAPPDTNGEVGETQYVQIVNEGFQIFNKSTGASVVGPTAISAVWAGFGGACETGGAGDPVVLYDQIDKRWLISQFASPSGGAPITDECIAVSQTSDATGAYNRYGFHLGSNFFDYPHLSVWPDGYYMSMNVFNSSGTAYLGPQPFAFDRAAMLAGTPTTFVTPGLLGASEDPILPGDLDGSTLPPLGAPNPFVEFPGGGTYKVYRFHADFATPANSTFTLAGSPAAAGYTSLCPSTRACVPQPGGVAGDNLDGIGDRLMFRLAYRNFGDHEALVGNYSVSASSVAGVRWFELRNATSGSPTVFQESTYQPDTVWRWMGSAAMDTMGNLAVGFSSANSSTNPQLRYAGRLANDPLNTLAQGESHLFDGGGHQTGTGNRWGDYSDLTVDPVDDCTFWFTSEYYSTTGAYGWKTRIGNFKFPNCSLTAGFTLSTTPPAASVCAGTPVTFTVNVGSTAAFNSPVTLAASGNPPPSTVGFTPNPVPTLPGSSSMLVGNTTTVAAGVYPIVINGTATGATAQTATANLSVFTVVPPTPTLVSPANAATNQPIRPAFSWSGSNTETYTIDVATDSGFTNIVFTQAVTGTSVTPNVDLASNTTYYWRVSPANACGAGPASAVFTFTTLPLPGDCSAGTTPTAVYSYGFESGLNGWSLGAGSIGNTWADNTASFHSGAHSWKANDTGAVSDQRFISPSIALPSGQLPLTLQFWTKRDIEQSGATSCYDGAILEASTNAGATWTQVNSAALLTDPYTGLVSSAFANPLAGLQAWCGVQNWTNSIVDISSYAGQNAQFRYRLGSDNSVGHDGWYLDDVKVQSCVAGVQHTVTPQAGPNGSIAPSTPQVVNDGATTSFTLTPDPGYSIGTVTGCGGSLAGNIYTTAPVTADCTVNASFAVVPPTYTVGGNVSGLAGSGLVLQLNGIDSLPVNANGTFTFPTALANGAAYAVTVATQPANPAQTCTVANGSGTIAGANVTNVAVTCTTNPPPTYTVGGNVSGLSGSGLVLKLNGANDLAISANGTFTFPTALADGSAYAVTVGTQPANPAQTCTVANGSGTLAGANVTNVAVTCTTNPQTYTVGGNVSTLFGSGLVLQLNGGDDLSISANGTFTFPTALANGSPYAVTVATQPSNPTQVCTVANGVGTIAGANVTDVAVTCQPDDTIFKDGFDG